jgi:hypothetical protein
MAARETSACAKSTTDDTTAAMDLSSILEPSIPVDVIVQNQIRDVILMQGSAVESLLQETTNVSLTLTA